MTAAELAALPDALWLRHKMSIVPGSWEVIEKDDFLAAIKEAMQAQRKRDAEICRELAEGKLAEDCDDWPECQPNAVTGAETCAAAIEREPLL